MTTDMNTDMTTNPLISKDTLGPPSKFKPPFPSKRRVRKDKHSRDARKKRKSGKGGKLRSGGHSHRDSIRGWQGDLVKDTAPHPEHGTNPLLIPMNGFEPHRSICLV